MTFTLTILGSSSALPSVGKYPSAHVLNAHEQFYLIDAGEGVQVQLKRYGINSLKLRAIFISHLHGDHLFGLFGLISTMGLLGREMHLDIYGPAPLDKILTEHMAFFDQSLPYSIAIHTVPTNKTEKIYENKVMEVYTIPLKHRIPAAGYLFKEKIPALNIKKEMIALHGLSLRDIVAIKRGESITTDAGQRLNPDTLAYLPYSPRSIAYCSDTAYSKKVVEAVKGVDLLYHEATFLNSEAKTAKKTGHSTAAQAATVAKEAGVGKLVMGHFSLRYNGENGLFLKEAKEIFENSLIAVEGQAHTIVAQKP